MHMMITLQNSNSSKVYNHDSEYSPTWQNPLHLRKLLKLQCLLSHHSLVHLAYPHEVTTIPAIAITITTIAMLWTWGCLPSHNHTVHKTITRASHTAITTLTILTKFVEDSPITTKASRMLKPGRKMPHVIFVVNLDISNQTATNTSVHKVTTHPNHPLHAQVVVLTWLSKLHNFLLSWLPLRPLRKAQKTECWAAREFRDKLERLDVYN